MGMKGNSSIVDLESLKALVSPSGPKIIVDKVVKEGSVLLLPGAKRKRGSSFRQVCASLLANIGTINTGMAFGFSAIALPQMQDAASDFKIDSGQASWIASLSSVTTPIGCILSGYLMDAIGRKRILILTQFPLIAGWLMIASATTVPMVYAGRLLVGLGSGMVGAPARVYTAEATQPHLRGMLAALASVGVSLGVLIEYALGAVFQWPIVALLSSMVPTIALVGSFLLPESPSWLMSAGREEDCKAALEKLRGPTCDVEYEASQLVSFAHQHNIHKPTLKETLKGLVHPSAYKPFFILAFYFLIYQFSGVNPITFYAVQIFQDSGASIDKNVATVITGGVRLVFTIVSCAMLRRCGRRPLTFISSIGCGIPMVLLGTYMYYKARWIELGEPLQMTWVPVFALLVFTAASVMGYLVVPWVMIGEVFPTQVRGVIGGITSCSAHFFIFFVVKTYPMLHDGIGSYGTFWLYGGISLLGTIFFYAFLPETKGRTLQDIEDYFSGRTKSLKNPTKPSSNKHPAIIQVPKGSSLP
ncbi:facilitated trehalose transporter Tret1-like [Cimex lectularius]|uniref:Major facilitator superfamily (MFS) profile domain-containing protein n=1 Tax=Cimex lectularius TaxID=79782 RepID=A0A8I6RDE5_CIMLE|nr:facilitated trehalose transporter Tret1-like [Cimex lectularius]